MAHVPLTREQEWRYAKEALTWYGWGSPIGLGFGLLCIGIAAALIRLAIIGF
jgi:hypothetical protein